MTWWLFLDDLRDPPPGHWVVARSVAAAVGEITARGMPTAMSLDHDLGDGVDGPALLHHLINAHLRGQAPPGLFDVQLTVHSANPVGRRNMLALWAQFTEKEGP